MDNKTINLQLNTLLQVGSIVGIIVTATWFVADIKYHIDALDKETHTLSRTMNSFIKDQKKFNADQTQMLQIFARDVAERVSYIKPQKDLGIIKNEDNLSDRMQVSAM